MLPDGEGAGMERAGEEGGMAWSMFWGGQGRGGLHTSRELIFTMVKPFPFSDKGVVEQIGCGENIWGCRGQRTDAYSK